MDGGKECKEDFEQIGEIHCPRCYRDIAAVLPSEEKVCKIANTDTKRGNMVEHEALYRYNT